MMVKDGTKFTNTIWGVGACLNVCVCVCKVSYKILSLEGRTPKLSVDMEGVYSTGGV